MSVGDFFKGKSVFITGGAGFIGKVLIEKLLRSCDGIEKIYMLIREKKGKSPDERIKLILECPLFEKLAKTKPQAFKKIVPILGNVAELKLGLSDEDMQTIIENVDIIYHSAASVRFDDYLKDSILLNARGTREIVEIALQARKPVVFVHVSTTFCNCDRKYLEEKIYPPHADWRDFIRVAEEMDQYSLNILSEKIIHPLPNTYVFAKSLGEHIVNDLCKGNILAAIVRPSVVIPTIYDPFGGWIDNFNGPVGLLTAGGKGLLKVSYGDEEQQIDYIPVDVLIKTIILLTYEKSLSRNINEVSVYNAVSSEMVNMKNKDLLTLGDRLTWDAPFTELLWYPSFMLTNNWYIYFVGMLIYHILPALMVDGLLKLLGKKPMLIKMQRKIYSANIALIHFMQNSWKFVNNKSMALEKLVKETEREKFSFSDCIYPSEEDLYAFFMKGKMHAGSYLLKEEFNRKKAFRNTILLWLMDRLLHYTVFVLFAWYLLVKLKIQEIICNSLNNYVSYINEL